MSRSNLYHHFVELSDALALAHPNDAECPSLVLSVDDYIDVQLRELPAGYLVLSCELHASIPQHAADIFEFNVFDEEPHPVVLACTFGGNVLLWQRLPEVVLRDMGMHRCLDRFVGACKELAHPN